MWQELREYFWRIGEYGWGKVFAEWLLIGVVIYTVLSFLKGTRGLRLIRGLILILLVVFLIVKVVVAKLGLDRISVLIEPFLYLIAFGSLVGFQPELRRAFIRVGEAGWLRRFVREGERTINPIISAVAYLSAHKIGALIAIERRVGLGTIIENGAVLDARLSCELLQTIFWPGSALHDLGVVIQEGRIAAAACQFPLTESDEIDPSLGSRHRAAVGLTEDSDAVVLVVSEENGKISLSVGGKLYRGLTPEALDAQLKELLQAVPK